MLSMLGCRGRAAGAAMHGPRAAVPPRRQTLLGVRAVKGLCPDCRLRESIESPKADDMTCAARGPDGRPDTASTCGTNRRWKAERASKRLK